MCAVAVRVVLATCCDQSEYGIGACDRVLRAVMLERRRWHGRSCRVCGCRAPHRPDTAGGTTKARNASFLKSKGGTRRPRCHCSQLASKALEEVSAVLRPGEQLCAFLDDVYAMCQLDRVKVVRFCNLPGHTRPASGQDESLEQKWRAT